MVGEAPIRFDASGAASGPSGRVGTGGAGNAVNTNSVRVLAAATGEVIG